MANQSYTTEFMERYLAGELPEADQHTFEQAMDEQPELEEEFRRHMLARGAVFQTAREQWREDKRQQLREWRESDQQSPSISWYQMAAAIGFLLTIGLGIYTWQSQQVNPENLFITYYQIESAPSPRTQALASSLLRGYQAFNQQNYQQALAIWDSLPESGMDRFTKDEVAYYRGLSYLELGQTTAAIQQLERITEPAFRPKAHWYLALLWIKEDQPEKAKALLQPISQQASPYQKKAATLLNQLTP